MTKNTAILAGLAGTSLTIYATAAIFAYKQGKKAGRAEMLETFKQAAGEAYDELNSFRLSVKEL